MAAPRAMRRRSVAPLLRALLLLLLCACATAWSAFGCVRAARRIATLRCACVSLRRTPCSVQPCTLHC
jgi:hypothetical protein